MISEPTAFSYGCKTTVLADELYVLSDTKKYGVLWPFKKKFSQNCTVIISHY